MMQLIVGDESLQFYFVESKVNPVRVSHSVSYLSGTLTVYAGWIKHLTLGITDISPVHEYKFWNVPLSAFGSLDPDKYYYLYAKCSTSAETGEYILSETPVEIDGVSWVLSPADGHTQFGKQFYKKIRTTIRLHRNPSQAGSRRTRLFRRTGRPISI